MNDSTRAAGQLLDRGDEGRRPSWSGTSCAPRARCRGARDRSSVRSDGREHVAQDGDDQVVERVGLGLRRALAVVLGMDADDRPRYGRAHGAVDAGAHPSAPVPARVRAPDRRTSPPRPWKFPFPSGVRSLPKVPGRGASISSGVRQARRGARRRSASRPGRRRTAPRAGRRAGSIAVRPALDLAAGHQLAQRGRHRRPARADHAGQRAVREPQRDEHAARRDAAPALGQAPHQRQQPVVHAREVGDRLHDDEPLGAARRALDQRRRTPPATARRGR